MCTQWCSQGSSFVEQDSVGYSGGGWAIKDRTWLPVRDGCHEGYKARQSRKDSSCSEVDGNSKRC